MALEEQVVDRLIHLGYTVSFAESCTGGLCCGTLVNVANASKVLNASFVTYANAAKIRFLGVEADTILNYGVVSEQVAAQLKSRWAWSVLGFAYRIRCRPILANLAIWVATGCASLLWNSFFPNCWRFCKTGSAVLFLRGSCDFSLDFLREI